MKQIKRFRLLEQVDDDYIPVALWFTDGTKAIISLTVKAIAELEKKIKALPKES